MYCMHYTHSDCSGGDNGAQGGGPRTAPNHPLDPPAAPAPAQGGGGRGANRREPAALRHRRGVARAPKEGPAMKVKERVRYGNRGQGSLIRYEGVEHWY